MKSTDLSPAQCQAIRRRLRTTMVYLAKLEARMEQRNFPRDDKLFGLVQQAHDAVRDLFLDAHELGCKGVGRASERSQAPQRGKPRRQPPRAH